jgi:hypothetical protein
MTSVVEEGNGKSQGLAFQGYIAQRIQDSVPLLPRVDAFANKRTDTSSEVCDAIKNLNPKKPEPKKPGPQKPDEWYPQTKSDEWYAQTQSIVDAVMAATPSLDRQKVTTAVAYDVDALLRDFINQSKGTGAGR